jgi:hypothetical protein
LCRMRGSPTPRLIRAFGGAAGLCACLSFFAPCQPGGATMPSLAKAPPPIRTDCTPARWVKIFKFSKVCFFRETFFTKPSLEQFMFLSLYFWSLFVLTFFSLLLFAFNSPSWLVLSFFHLYFLLPHLPYLLFPFSFGHFSSFMVWLAARRESLL